MAQESKKKAALWLILVLAVLAPAALLFWYVNPVPITYDGGAVSSCDPTDTAHVTLELKVRRHLFAPEEITGTIVVDEVGYESLSTSR